VPAQLAVMVTAMVKAAINWQKTSTTSFTGVMASSLGALVALLTTAVQHSKQLATATTRGENLFAWSCAANTTLCQSCYYCH